MNQMLDETPFTGRVISYCTESTRKDLCESEASAILGTLPTREILGKARG